MRIRNVYDILLICTNNKIPKKKKCVKNKNVKIYIS